MNEGFGQELLEVMDVQVEEVKEEPKPEVPNVPATLPEIGDLSNEQLLASFFSRS